MTARLLLPNQPITTKGDTASRELIEVIQRLVGQVSSLQSKIDAIAAVAAPTGGFTTDAEARAAIAAIIAAAQ